MLPPVTPHDAGAFARVLATIKPFVPLPAVAVLLYALWWFFRATWQELDEDATRFRAQMALERKSDHRPLIALPVCALVLTMQEYYGGRTTYDDTIRPFLSAIEAAHPRLVHMAKFDELYGYGWWALTRIVGYVSPLLVWRVCFPRDSLLDMGFRLRGFFKHAWIYALFLGLVLPSMLLVSHEPDFGSYYPFYKQCSRSWFDLLVWEAMYFAQFFGLEVFFRGFWLGSLRRSFGSGAVFAMAVPYCMIHYGKPFLEANGAIIAGIALGSLSMKTKSIYQGFLVHITVAALMDWLALWHRHGLPHVFWPP